MSDFRAGSRVTIKEVPPNPVGGMQQNRHLVMLAQRQEIGMLERLDPQTNTWSVLFQIPSIGDIRCWLTEEYLDLVEIKPRPAVGPKQQPPVASVMIKGQRVLIEPLLTATRRYTTGTSYQVGDVLLARNALPDDLQNHLTVVLERKERGEYLALSHNSDGYAYHVIHGMDYEKVGELKDGHFIGPQT